MEDQGTGVLASPRPESAPTAPSGGSAGKVLLILGGVVLFALLAGCALLLYSTSLMGDGVSGGDAVALIHVSGVITGTAGTGGGVTPERLISEIEAAEDDSSVKAILLRIDSPGGTVAASQEIATAVARAEKPVVASIGDAGASGAYMIASQCDEIVASPTSAVGSIGVVMEVPNLQGLMEKVGVDVVVLTKGELKDAGSPYRELSDKERELIDAQMQIAYDEFIGLVAEGRSLPEAKVREMATGWVWMGVEAKRMGLIDTLGNYSDAVLAAGKLGGIEGDPTVLDFDEPELPTLLRTLLSIAENLPSLTSVDAKDLVGTTSPAVPR